MIEIENFNLETDRVAGPFAERIKLMIERTCKRELGTLPAAFHDKVLRQPLSELRRRISVAFDNFKIDQVPDAIADFARELRAAVIHERANNPALRPWSAEDQIKLNVNALKSMHWNGVECAEIQRMLLPGDVIARIALREIELVNGVVQTRGDIHRHAIERRPRGVTPDNETFLRQNFTTDQELESIETAERIAKDRARRYTSGPPSLVGTIIPGLE